MLRNAANFKDVEIIIKQSTKVPLGTILPYFHETNLPENYMWCNGSDCSNREISSIGIVKTPDIRGRFLRMANDSHGFGSLEEDTIRNITGYHFMSDRNVVYGAASNASGCFKASRSSGRFAPSGDRDSCRIDFDASLVVPTSDEVRPINMVIMYIIYVGEIITKLVDIDKKNFKAILLKITSFYYKYINL